MRRSIIAVTIVALTGCATAPPNTPGAGAGDTYTPFVDLQGVDSNRYSSDLAGCRNYAQQIDAGKQAMAGMVAGMFIGALIGGAVGGNRYQAERGALSGGALGVSGAGGRAVLKQETVIANCMAGRGYRVLEGATVATNLAAPSPYTATGYAPVPTTAPLATAAAPQPQPTSLQAGAVSTGQDAASVKVIALQELCTSQPNITRITGGQSFDIYGVTCTNGKVLSVQCEMGSCRAIK